MRASGRTAALWASVAMALALAGAARAQEAAAPAAPETAAPLAVTPGAVPAGAYLAARAASAAFDFAAAADLLANALADGGADPWLLESAIVADLSLGRLAPAAELAARALAAGLALPAAHLALQADRAAQGDWQGLVDRLDEGQTVGPLVDGLARGWARQGLGQAEAALAAFDELAASPGLKAFGLTHKALAMALQGDLAGAEAILASDGLPPTRRSVLAHAEVLSALGRNDDAVALVDESFGEALDATLGALRARLAAGERLPFTFVASAAEGLSEAYLNVAAALADTEAPTALLYARAALALDPARTDAALLTASLLEDLGQPLLASDAFALVPKDDPAFLAAELGRAGVLRAEGEEAAALEVLSALARDLPERGEIRAALGDLLRGMDRHAEAEGAYDKAIELSPEGASSLWYLHFARALSRQAQDDWTGTEADLRAALALRPDQPQVLNHLGYSLVERGEKLPEALGLLEQAVALRPDSGAIVDSLGWAYFKLGRHADAVVELEKAAALEPNDPVVNDHLGDAYWRVGREREARVQWSRALSLEPEPAAAEAIRRKLAEGLSADGATPAETALIDGGSQGG